MSLSATYDDLVGRYLAPADPRWTLEYAEYEPEWPRSRETVCTLANGYVGVRGAAEDAAKNDPRHYPGTYLAGARLYPAAACAGGVGH